MFQKVGRAYEQAKALRPGLCLVELANLVLNRHETRTVLRVANGWPVGSAAQRLWITGPAAVPQ